MSMCWRETVSPQDCSYQPVTGPPVSHCYTTDTYCVAGGNSFSQGIGAGSVLSTLPEFDFCSFLGLCAVSLQQPFLVLQAAVQRDARFAVELW